ncbi:hypothetical protein M4I21_08930 [Cellulophaga sp. 20_2_10]|uniref:hypothetical protein n=1 Tax=Cellulophaga sp. 20_2_10 TaxID=2942476 RepID=UPI00201A3E63|nr:hypothetical protein [Cellulophaga sp. 20_2_10]MCL5245926.1 hypothetical protein [Cellulophaga sp. 20_2_10]
MKTLATLFFILCVSLSVQAQKADRQPQEKVMIVTITKIVKGSTTLEKTVENSVARLYLIKNAKITKELSFITKGNKAKLV